MVFGTSDRTTADLIRQTLQHLRGSMRHPTNALAQEFTSMQSQMVMQFPVVGVQVGQAIEIGLNVYLVTDVNTATQTLGVVPETTASTHAADSRVTMRPSYSVQRIITELNNELLSLSSEGLYRVVSVEAMDDDDNTVVVPEGALTVLDVWSREEGVSSRQLPEAYYNIVDTPSGVELRGPKTIDFAVFGCAFNLLPDDDDTVNVVDTTGLQATAVDIPPLGAAVNLITGSESQRNITSSQGDARRADEVPPGAISGAMQNLVALRRRRLIQEVSRVQQRYSYTKRVGIV